MPTFTTNYGFTKPTDGGDSNVWGGFLNTSLDGIDTQVKNRQNEAAAAQTTANAALPKAGGVMTGRVDGKTATAARQNFAAASGTVTLDCSVANFFSIDTSGNITIAFSNVPNVASTAVAIVVYVSAGGAHTVSWPASVEWPGNITPAQTASQVDIYALVTIDGGTSWKAVRVARDID